MSKPAEEAPKPTTIDQALVAAQEQMPAVEPDATNPHFESKFVSLGHLLAKARPVLHRNGLAIVQTPILLDDGRFALRVLIVHEGGERMEFTAPLPTVKSDPQALGSSITYLRRYTLASLLGVSDQRDDDGEGASDADVNPPLNAVSEKRAEALYDLWKHSTVDPARLGLWLVQNGSEDVDAGSEDSLAKAISALPSDKADALETKLREKAGVAA